MKTKSNVNPNLIESKLRKSELRYRRLFETAQDGILILDAATGMIEDVNPYLVNMLGYAREEFINKKLWEVGAFKDIEVSKDAFEALQKKECIRYDDLALKTKSGKLIQVEFISNLYLVGDEKIIQCNIRDITERKRMAKELAEKEKKYIDLVDHSPDGIFIIDLNGKFLSVNDAICNGLGFTQEEFLRLSIQDIIPEQYVIDYEKEVKRIIKGKNLDEVKEYVLLGKDGKIHYVEVVATPHYQGKNIIGLQGIARDITSRKRAEEALQSSNQILAGIINAIPARVFWKDKDLIYQGCNDIFARDAGFNEPRDIIGKDDFQMGWRDQAEMYRNDDRKVIEGNAAKQLVEEPQTTPDGKTITLLTSKVPLRSSTGDVIGLIGTYLDITTRKQAELELQQSHEMIVKLTAMVPGVVYQFRSWPDGRSAFPFSSPGMNDIYEVTPEEVREDATPVYGRLHPDDYDRIVEAIAESARTLSPFHCEFRVILPRQGLRWRLSDALPERMDDGSTLWYGIISDISERKLAEEVLERERRDYQTIIDTSPVMVAYKSKDDHFIKVNSAYADYMGLSPEQIIGKTTFDLIKQPDVAQLGRDSDLEVMRSGKPILNKLVKVSGFSSQKEIWATFSKLPFKDADGNIIGTVSFISDVDDRVKAENALRESEERFRALIENSSDAITMLDVEGKTIYDSPAAPGMLGYGPNDWIGKNVFELLHPDDSTRIMEAYRELVGTPGNRLSDTFRVRHKNGSWLWLTMVATNLLSEPSVQAIVLNYHDITKRKEVEEALVNSEERYKSLVETQSDLIARSDLEGRLTFVNDAYCKTFGKTREELLGEIFTPTVSPEDRPTVLAMIKAIQRTPHQMQTVTRHPTPSGVRVLSWDNVAVLDEFGKVRELQGVGRDITDQKLAEEALAISEERYRVTLESMMEGCQIIGFDWRYLLVNDSAAGQGKFRKEDMLGHTMMECYPGIEKTDLFSELQHCMTQRTSHQMENKFAYPDGTTGWFELSIQPSVNGIFILSTEITARKQAEEELIQANNRLSLAQHSSKTGVWDWDIITGKLDWSPELFELFGLDAPTTPTFEIWQNVMHPDDVQTAGDRIDQAIRDHKPLSNEYRIVLPSGDVLWINALGDTIYNEQGEPQRMSGICIDITERKQVEQRIQRQLEHLNSLSAIDRVITTNFDLNITLSEILTHVTKELEVDAADIFLLDPISDILENTARAGFTSKSVKRSHLRMGESYAGRVALERKLIHVPNLKTESVSPLLHAIAAENDFTCYFGVPLINKGKVRGVLEVFHRKHLEPDAEWYDFLNSLAGQAAIAIENASLYESQQRTYQELTQAYDATIEGWSHAMDLRDKDTEGHTLRVTDITLKLAREFGLNDAELMQVRWGTLLHDIGKIGVPDGILLKPGPLTDEEWVVMRKHPTFAYEMLSPINYLRRALDIPYCHHEKWDGTGYPQGLKERQIPLAARIFAVVDVWDALRSDRPYRSAWPDEKVYEHIRSLSGTHFDPQVVDAFLKQPRN